jgi:hypothetical protein
MPPASVVVDRESVHASAHKSTDTVESLLTDLMTVLSDSPLSRDNLEAILEYSDESARELVLKKQQQDILAFQEWLKNTPDLLSLYADLIHPLNNSMNVSEQRTHAHCVSLISKLKTGIREAIAMHSSDLDTLRILKTRYLESAGDGSRAVAVGGGSQTVAVGGGSRDVAGGSQVAGGGGSRDVAGGSRAIAVGGGFKPTDEQLWPADGFQADFGFKTCIFSQTPPQADTTRRIVVDSRNHVLSDKWAPAPCWLESIMPAEQHFDSFGDERPRSSPEENRWGHNSLKEQCQLDPFQDEKLAQADFVNRTRQDPESAEFFSESRLTSYGELSDFGNSTEHTEQQQEFKAYLRSNLEQDEQALKMLQERIAKQKAILRTL